SDQCPFQHIASNESLAVIEWMASQRSMMRNLSARVGSLGQVSKTNSDHILPKERSNFFSDNTLKTKLFGNGIRVDLPPQMNVSHHDPNRWGSLSMPSPCSDCHARP